MSLGRCTNLGALVLVNLMWAAQYPAYKLASDHLEASALGFWTFLCGAVLMLPFWLKQRRNASPVRGFWGAFLLLAVLGLLPPSVLLAWGIAHASASNAAILSLTIPVLMVLMGRLLLNERLTAIRIVSLVLALIGTVAISQADLAGGSFRLAVLAGNLAIFAAGAGSAFYNVFSKRLLERFTELEVLIYGYILGAGCCAVLSCAMDARPFYRIDTYPAAAWGALLVLGGLSWGLAMVLWMWSLKRLAIGQISASVYLLPVFGVMLTAITLHERLTMRHLAGGGLVLAGTFLTSEYETRRRQVVAGHDERTRSRSQLQHP